MVEETEDEEGEVYWNCFRKGNAWLIGFQTFLEFCKDVSNEGQLRCLEIISLDTYDSMARTIAACISAAIKNAHVQGVVGLKKVRHHLYRLADNNYLYIFLPRGPVPMSGGVNPSRE